MNSTISCKRYVEYGKLASTLDSMIQKISTFREEISLDMYDLTQVDDAPDLTDIHPRDRENLRILCGVLPFDGKGNLGSILQQESDDLMNLKGFVGGNIFFMTPHSILPLHTHDVTRPPNTPSGCWNACLGITVPSADSALVGIEVNGEVFCHGAGVDVTFDPQTPHQAWNHTNDWWTMLILNIDKKFFI